MKSIEIMLIPSLLSTIKNMGIDQDEYDEDVDCDAISYQQGYDIDSMEIAPGEKFTIDENWEKAVFDCAGETYFLIMRLPSGEPEVNEFDHVIHFGQGKYLFHEDGKTFEVLEDLGFFF